MGPEVPPAIRALAMPTEGLRRTYAIPNAAIAIPTSARPPEPKLIPTLETHLFHTGREELPVEGGQ